MGPGELNGTGVMQQCLPNRAAGGIPVAMPPAGAETEPLRHRALILTGPRRGTRADMAFARRILDRVLQPAAQVEGVDLHLCDPWLADRAASASSHVLLMPPLGNLSNPFYAVHPRRNDRFVAARAPLRALYPEVDFTPFAFTGHALGTLAATCPERFSAMRQVLTRCWRRRMLTLLGLLPAQGALVVLPQPAFLPCPDLDVVGIRVISVEPDDRAPGAERLGEVLFGL
jgi:hypothetical protein